MKCNICNNDLARGEEIKWERNKFICEDCYLDAAMPVRTCDPESVRIARNMQSLGLSTTEVSQIQAQILEVIEETGGVTPEVLAERLQVDPENLQWDLAALRHMRRIKGEKRGEKKYLLLYGDKNDM